MKELLLGNAIKRDRKKLGIPQYEVQKRVKDLSIKKDERLTKHQKKLLLNSHGNSVRTDKGWIHASIGANLISKIERGVAREVHEHDLALIAEALDADLSEYLKLEINPMKLVGIQLEPENESSTPFFERAIEFEPEHRVAGTSILSFFSEIVESEFSNQSVKVGIVQSSNSVTLRVETPDGQVLKEVQKALNNYGLVVMGDAPVNSVSRNPQVVQELKTRLEVVNLELKLRTENALENSKQYESRITSLENQLEGLQRLVGQSLSQQSGLVETIQSLSKNSQPSEAFVNAISLLSKVVHEKQSRESEINLENSLNTIESEAPGTISRLKRTFESIPASIAANFATPWVQSIIMSFPK